MSDDPTGEDPRPPAPGGGFEEMEARRRRVLFVLAGLTVLAVAAALLVAFVPRTVASGELDGTTWSLRVAPGIVSPTIRLDTDPPDGEPSTTVIDGSTPPAVLADTSVVQVPSDAPAATIVVGPTPRGVDSVRITSLERGVGEAGIERVAWRRIHLAVIPDDVWVTDLVAIARDGSVLDTVRDLPVPGAVELDGEADTGTTPDGEGDDPDPEAGSDGDAVEVGPQAGVEVDPGADVAG